jgi:polysaccharide biosynthesis transport protein
VADNKTDMAEGRVKGSRRLVSIRDVLYVFFKNEYIILVTLLTAVVAATIYCFLASPIYRAETKILVRLGKAQTSGMEQYREAYNLLFQERTQNIHNEMELIRGQYLTQKVLAKLKDNFANASAKHHVDVNKKSALKFLEALRVQFLEESDMIRVTFDWEDAEFAALVANSYAEEYLDHHTKVHESKRSYKFYTEQIDSYEKKLNEAEDALQTFLNTTGIANIALQKDVLLRNVADAEIRYQEAAVEHGQVLTKFRKIKEMITQGGWVETPDIGSKGIDKQAYLRTLDESYFRLMAERIRLLQYFTPKADEVQSVDRQLSNLRSQKNESLLNIAAIDLASAELRKNVMRQELSAKRKELQKINAHTAELRELERRRDIIEANYLLYKKKGEDLRIADDLDKRRMTSVTIATPAIPPLSPAYPRKALVIVLSAVIGLFLSFCFCAVREFFNHTFKDDDSVFTMLGTPLLVSVPQIRDVHVKASGD